MLPGHFFVGECSLTGLLISEVMLVAVFQLPLPASTEPALVHLNPGNRPH
jgi:hypothetical protein